VNRKDNEDPLDKHCKLYPTGTCGKRAERRVKASDFPEAASSMKLLTNSACDTTTTTQYGKVQLW